MRYLLGKHARLAIWVAEDGEWICGNKTFSLHQPRLKPNRGDAVWATSREATRLVDRILGEHPTPLPFHDLMKRVAKHWSISDKRALLGPDLAQQGPSVGTKLAQRGWLKRVWREIAELPRAQRISLLLNLRDEHGEAALTLLPVTAVATLAQIATVLEI